MQTEIERKFLVRSNEWLDQVTSRLVIRQAYLSSSDKSSIRVRIKDDQAATLCIKSRPATLRRMELELPIAIEEAKALFQLRHGFVINKIRHIVPWRDLKWEIDIFTDENAGLVVAEIELNHEHRLIELPNWIGQEITGQRRYYNGQLVNEPYCTWQKLESAQRAIAN